MRTELRHWVLDIAAPLGPYLRELERAPTVHTAAEAKAWCAGVSDDVAVLARLRPAPDAIVESQYRAMIAETRAAMAGCAKGDGRAMVTHMLAMQQHSDAMWARIRALDPEGTVTPPA
jgi:hypothetical protein